MILTVKIIIKGKAELKVLLNGYKKIVVMLGIQKQKKYLQLEKHLIYVK